ncbi:DUF3558 family protein [Gordonia sp. DT30]|uniref:DUF3558 family protein n=1 Tax=Gordonia sp. DT30 TaxID=3416546 RepID=UPI003CF989CC
MNHHTKELVVIVFAATLVAAVSSCSRPADPSPQMRSSPSHQSAVAATIRQTDSEGRHLPFTTKFPDRWNSSNDGTTYEPCTAVTTAILQEFALDPSSVKDTAIANHQTARGCNWTFADNRFGRLSQFLGNGPTLNEYKVSKAPIIRWLPNIQIASRTIAVGARDEDNCSTYLKSGSAVIVTSASIAINPPPIDQLCATAIAFTEATIDKMPP